MQIPWVSNVFRRLFRRPAAIRPGLYHYPRESEGAITRFHLRIDPAGDGLLFANGAAVRRLWPSEVIVAKGLFDGDDPAIVAQQARKCLRHATGEQIAVDRTRIDALIETIVSPDESYPFLNLVEPAFSAKSMRLERPIAADVRLCPPFFMTRILDRLWELAIPHVTIVVGRDPDEAHLIRALTRATELGMIAGVRGCGSDLAHHGRISKMAAASLYHLDIYCHSATDAVHDALAGPGDRKMAVQALGAAHRHNLCGVAQIAIVQSSLATIDATLNGFASHGLKNVCVFAIATTDANEAAAGALPANELAPAARLVERSAERLGLRMAWHPTVRFDPAVPLGEQVCRGPRSSGDGAIRVTPDGSVFFARGPYVAAGNLLSDSWEAIAQSEVYRNYRRRAESDTVAWAEPEVPPPRDDF